MGDEHAAELIQAIEPNAHRAVEAAEHWLRERYTTATLHRGP